MKLCVVGAGGIGATIAARLAAGGHEVCVVARGAHLAAIQAGGLRFVDHAAAPDADGRSPVVQSGVYRLAAAAEGSAFGPQDAVFLAVKAHQINAVLPSMRALVGPATAIIPAINGLPWWYFQGMNGRLAGLHLRALDPDGTLAAALPVASIIGCVVHLAGELRGPGEVHCTAGRRLILGPADRSACGPVAAPPQRTSLDALAQALRAAGFTVECSADIRRDIWVKLIGNLSFNPIAALTGYRMDQLCADEAVLDVIRAILREGAAVAGALDIAIGMSPDQRIAIARQLGSARISMLQDLEAGRSLEIAPIVGAVLELATRLGIDVPTTRTVHALIQARVQALGLPLR
jgi:2-dehydropantoate 2-reductase